MSEAAEAEAAMAAANRAFEKYDAARKEEILSAYADRDAQAALLAANAASARAIANGSEPEIVAAKAIVESSIAAAVAARTRLRDAQTFADAFAAECDETAKVVSLVSSLVGLH